MRKGRLLSVLACGGTTPRTPRAFGLFVPACGGTTPRTPRAFGLLVLAASVISIAAPASAAPAKPGPTGLFVTWRAAQAAARFPLLRPTKTDGLARNSKISVARCEISRKKAAKRVVIASYGLTPQANLTLSQNNSNGPCSRLAQGKFLGRFRVEGRTAVLIGDCDRRGLPSCASKNIFLFLTWRKHGIYYQTSSFGERPGVLLAFARTLVHV